MKVENQKVVSAIYEMYVKGEEEGKEELIEQASEKTPLVYCHGEGMMLPAFEAALAGKEVGDSFDIRLTPEEAYGDYDESGLRELDKTMFHNADGVFDSDRVYTSAVVPMRTVDGQIVNAQIVEVGEDKVMIDLNHPLAGEDLHFIGKIIDIREATEAELDAIRHPHCGCGGHCGGSCNGSCDGNCNGDHAENCHCNHDHAENCDGEHKGCTRHNEHESEHCKK